MDHYALCRGSFGTILMFICETYFVLIVRK